MQLNVVQFRYKIGYIVLNDSIPHNMEITDPAGNYIFKVNNRITRRRCKICSKLTTKPPERRHWRI